MLRTWTVAFIEKAPALFEESKAAMEDVRREDELTAERVEMLKTIG